MEDRLKRLETGFDKLRDQVSNIDRDVAVVKSNYARREDLEKGFVDVQKSIAAMERSMSDVHKSMGAQTWKIVGLFGTIAAAAGGAAWFIRTSDPPRKGRAPRMRPA